MTWRSTESMGLTFIQDHLDKNAILMGRSDSTKSDILLSDGSYVEVKQPHAQCGQFVADTAGENPYSAIFMSGTEHSSEDCRNWVRQHYKNKNVSYFLIGKTYDDFRLYSFEEFFTQAKVIFKLQNRSGTGKKSGSADLPQRDFQYIPEEWNAIIENKKAYSDCAKARYDYIDSQGIARTMYVSPVGNRIKKLSNTNNATWIFQMEVKDD